MNEIKLFFSQPKNTRFLLLTSLLYAFVLPVVDIFVAAYIMRNSSDVGRVMTYQLTVYSGIPVTFLINGYLLNKINPGKLYAFGMLLSGVSMLIMTSLPELNCRPCDGNVVRLFLGEPGLFGFNLHKRLK